MFFSKDKRLQERHLEKLRFRCTHCKKRFQLLIQLVTKFDGGSGTSHLCRKCYKKWLGEEDIEIGEPIEL